MSSASSSAGGNSRGSILNPAISVSTISRNPSEYTRATVHDIHKVWRNIDPALHPFERPREYLRALNAAKMERMFAKPFLYSLAGHMDGVYSLSTTPSNLTMCMSGSGDGEIRVWNLVNRSCLWKAKAHSHIVRGIVANTDANIIVSASMDSTVKIWKTQHSLDEINAGILPLQTYMGNSPFNAVDFQRKEDVFATAGANVELWSTQRSEPVHAFAWRADTVNTVKFSPVETHLLLSTASDRNIVLYDVRDKTPLKKIVMKMQTNAVSFNPMEAFYFTTANEDSNSYTFDLRKLDHALMILEDHVSAVISVDYAPTGREIVTGSYDRTLRIFPWNSGHSREVYHTKRMQRIFAVKFTADGRYILSGSDDMNLRVWKTHASEKLTGNLLQREREAKDYRRRLKERFQHTPEVRALLRDRKIPKAILRARRMKHEIRTNARNKEERVRKHSKEGSKPYVPAKKTAVRRQVE